MPDKSVEMSTEDRLTLLAADRLVFMRVLEKFANEVSLAVNSLKVDVAEVQRQIGIRNQALVDNGSIPLEETTLDVDVNDVEETSDD